jgi:MFS family permease
MAAVAAAGGALTVTVPYRWHHRLATRMVRTRGWESVVPQQLAGRDPAGTATVARPRQAVWLACILLGLTVLLLAASLVIAFTGGETWNAKLATTPVALAFAVVGALIAARTGNRLGWLFLAVGTVGSVVLAMEAYAERVPAAALPGAAWVGWTFVVILGIEGPLFFLTLLLFPDGRPPSWRWWPVAWVAITAAVVEATCSGISDVNFSSNFPQLRDPVVLAPPAGTAFNLAQEAGLMVLLAGAAAMIVRFRRSGPEQRLQLKWVMYASAVAAAAVLVVAQFSNDPLPAFAVFFPLIPASVGIAILKYRLYDIDRIISRTLAYAIVTGLLVGVYAGLVLLATRVLSFHSTVAVAAATLAAAALFSPLRRRVQQVVDRRFNRVRYDADQTVAAFAGRLRDAVDLDTLRADLLAVVNSAVEPAHSSVWIASHGAGPTA